MIEIFNNVTTNLDATLINASKIIFDVFAAQAAPFLALLIAVSLAFYAFNMATKGSFDIIGMLYFITRSFIVYGVVTGGVYWTKYLYPFIVGFGENVGTTVFEKTTTIPLFGNNFNSLLDSYFEAIADATQNLMDKIEPGTILNMAEIMGGLAGAITLLVALLMIALAFGILTIAKFFLMIVLSLAPLFFVWAYLGATKGIFDGWMNAITRILIVQVLVYAALGFLLASTTNSIEEIQLNTVMLNEDADNNPAILTKMWTIAFVSLFGVLIMSAIPTLSSALAGGMISIGATTVQYVNGSLAKAGGTAASKAWEGIKDRAGQVGASRSSSTDMGNAGEARQSAQNSAKERAQKLVARVERSDRDRRQKR